ncbi:hypothetical protein SAMN05421636_104252 [Pricia antarctica]|uniref:Uncharacterized protein n=1 Tax=Pricia antarctica TaxID=641691 RepID=A0A1G7BQM4_9FLAO|nr:hypothetical protein SAMN05421636_104252 [Pricia antarctica]
MGSPCYDYSESTAVVIRLLRLALYLPCLRADKKTVRKTPNGFQAMSVLMSRKFHKDLHQGTFLKNLNLILEPLDDHVHHAFVQGRGIFDV